MTTRSARFEVIAVPMDHSTPEGMHQTADYILLDIPETQIDAVYRQIALVKALHDAKLEEGRTTQPGDPNTMYVVDFYVKAHHQRLDGPKKPDGTHEATYPPSLLSDVIPRD